MSKSCLSPAMASLAGILLMAGLITCRGEPTTPQAPSATPTATPMLAPTPTVTPALTTAATPLEPTAFISEESHDFVTEDFFGDPRSGAVPRRQPALHRPSGRG